jgi:hypothetical protein
MHDCVERLRTLPGDFQTLTIETLSDGSFSITRTSRQRINVVYDCNRCKDTGYLDPNDHGGNLFECSCKHGSGC